MSKNIIFYFSGTGNSLSVAKSVAQDLKDTILLPMLKQDSLDYIGSQTEKIGLVFPVHMSKVPFTVKEFIEKIKLVTQVYFFAIVTHSGLPNLTGIYLNNILKKQNINLDGYFEIKMIINTPKGVAPKMFMQLNWELLITSEKIEAMVKESSLMTQEVTTKIQSEYKTSIQNIPSGFKKYNYWLMNLLWYVSDKSKPTLNFILNESCNGCGVCEKVCTTKRISMKNNKPEWINDQCNYCYACFNYCQIQAIGVEHYIKKLGRYHHPSISADDISKQTYSLF